MFAANMPIGDTGLSSIPWMCLKTTIPKLHSFPTEPFLGIWQSLIVVDIPANWLKKSHPVWNKQHTKGAQSTLPFLRGDLALEMLSDRITKMKKEHMA